ncbi:MAG: hypothetical protein EKK59_06010 [Neisseriaceae bacterium]|jgi:LEA14-like dessication related protein|nr:MAG: hypothetical protein EKK59_06010 [Neisseriaceae bacterium]
MKHYSAVLMIMLGLAGCAALISKPEPPTVKLAGISLTQANLLEQTFILKLQLSNPNDYALPIRGLRYQLEVNGQEFAHGGNLDEVTLAAKSDAIVEVDAKTNLQAWIKQLRNIGDKDKVTYRIHGEIAAPGANLQLPYDHKGETSLAALKRWLPR